MAHRPRKSSGSQNALVYWQEATDKRVLGFAGYKVGMTHVAYVDNSESPTKGQEVVSAATIIEVPPMTIYGMRCYATITRSETSSRPIEKGLRSWLARFRARSADERAKIDKSRRTRMSAPRVRMP